MEVVGRDVLSSKGYGVLSLFSSLSNLGGLANTVTISPPRQAREPL